MDPALFVLFKLRIRGALRRTFRGLKTPRRAVFFVVGLLMFCLWLGPSLLAAFTEERSNPETLRDLAPLGLLVMFVLTIVTSAGEKAIYFTPSEVDFLFAGPFERRELLVFKLACGALGALFPATFMSVFLLGSATWWVALFLGGYLAFLFVLLSSMIFVLIRQMITQYAYTRIRKLVLTTVLALSTLAVWQSLAAAGRRDAFALFSQFRHTWAGFCLLAPFDVFGRTMAAEKLFPEFIGWAALALAMNLALLGLVIRLDANYLEAAMTISQKVYDRMERVKRGGMASASISSRSARRRLPLLPRLGGAGPIAWRQLTTAIRNSRAQLALLVFIAAFAGSVLISTTGSGASPRGGLVWAVIGLAAWMTLWFAQVVSFDFRADLDRMDWLKMMPLRSSAIVLGQLATPVVIFTVLHLILFGGCAIFAQGWRPVLFAAAMLAFPYNFLLFGIDNLVFLMFPARTVAMSPGDFQFFGRQMVIFFVKILVALVSCGIAAGLGGLAFWVTGGSWAAFMLVSWMTLTVLAAATVPYIAWAFDRFDVSLDTPA